MQLNLGDVIRTNPAVGYWGIGIVLSENEGTLEMDPMCHVAEISSVFQHEVTFEELTVQELKILEIKNINFSPMGVNEFSHKVIGVYCRDINSNVSVIGNIDSSDIFNGPLPFSPDYGLEVTWPLCGEIESHFGIQAVRVWLENNNPSAIPTLILKSALEDIKVVKDVPENELWVIIENEFHFKSIDEIKLENELLDLFELNALGAGDGHSYGVNSFDINFNNVTNYENAKKEVKCFFSKKYPKINYRISLAFETYFEKV